MYDHQRVDHPTLRVPPPPRGVKTRKATSEILRLVARGTKTNLVTGPTGYAIAQALGTNRQATYRRLHRMCDEGLIQPAPGGGFQLTARGAIELQKARAK